MLIVENLYKEFPGTVAVDNLSFEIGEGVICGFIGPNGAGKTTTMRIISTLETPTSGGVFVDGTSIYRDPYRIRRSLGFMPDHLGIYPDLFVEDYLEFYSRAYGIEPETRRARIADIMEFTELDRVANKRVDTLSKGWRQRLNMGRALVNDPKLLVMDEPAAGLDPRARIELRLLIRALAERGKSVFISSHILTELSEICDEMLIIDEGRTIVQGKVGEIKKRAASSQAVFIHLLRPDQRDQAERLLLELPHILDLQGQPDGSLRLTFAGTHEQAAELLEKLVQNGIRLLEFRLGASSMEDVFMDLTKGAA